MLGQLTFVLFALSSSLAYDLVDVELSGGVIRGRVSYEGGRPAHVFKNVPMAEPPVGNRRFAKLEEKRPWRPLIWNSTEYSPACPSNTTDTTSPQDNISEDCIYMNVFADASCRRRASGCPILFYIHGGGFTFDSAVMFNETQLVQKYASDGVVFMIPAYRLGVLGFLDLGGCDTSI